VGLLTLHQMDDRDDRPGRKSNALMVGPRPVFEHHSGMMLVTDVAVSRQEYFGKKKGIS